MTTLQEKLANKLPDNFFLIPRCINGAIAGIVGVAAVYPLDLVKTRLQTQKPDEFGKPLYNSMWDAFIKIYRQEGLINMYRGMAVNLVFIVPEISLNLASNDFFRHLLKPEYGPMSITRQALAGALCGAVTITITSPMEFIKIQLQDNGTKNGESKLTARKVIVNVLQKNGFIGLYQGFIPCAWRDILFSVLYFPLFSVLYDLGPRDPYDGEPTNSWSFLCGIISGGLGSLFVSPFDVVKTRMQTLDAKHKKVNYPRIAYWFHEIYTKEGWRALFKGGACRVIVIAPLFGVTQMIYFIGLAEYILDVEPQKIVR